MSADLDLTSTTPSDLERSLDENANLILGVDFDIIRAVRDPWRCPIQFLPYLAWSRGVDLWYEDWPEDRKRAITADIYRLHALKGTLAGALTLDTLVAPAASGTRYLIIDSTGKVTSSASPPVGT